MHRYFVSYILKVGSEISFKNAQVDWHCKMKDIRFIRDIEEDMLARLKNEDSSISSVTIMNWREFEK